MVLLAWNNVPFVSAEEGQYKVKIHKSFMKQVIDRNFPVILQHLESIEERDRYLTQVNANIDELRTRIIPKSSEDDWESVESDLFFDKGQIVMELNNLQFIADGMLTDPETGVREKLSLKVDMDLCQLVLNLQTIQQDEYVYPKIEIDDVAFTLNAKTFDIKAEGDLPLYKAHKFEDGLKEWFTSQLLEREREFYIELQRSEREIMSTFAFKKEIQLSKNIGRILGSKTAISSLSEVMKLEGEHIIIDYMTEYQGADLSTVAQSMRQVKTEFSTEPEHQRDVQIVIDENQINYYLFSLFYADKPFSLTERLLEFIPEWLEPAAFLVKAIMNAQTFTPFFPGLAEFGRRRFDLKCNFDKQSLTDGQLDELQMSSVKFKDGNVVDMDLHFGCSLWLHKDDIKIPAMQEFMNFVLDLYDDDKDKWEKYRSFYISMNAQLEFDFSENAKSIKVPGGDWVNDQVKKIFEKDEFVKFPKMTEHVPLVFGRVVEFKPTIHELKMFNGDKEMKNEADKLNKAIMDARTHKFWENPYLQPLLELFYGHTIPIAPFPQVEGCLGMNPKDSQMTIKEGMAVMSYDYKVERSTTDCLFHMEEGKLAREAHRLRTYKKTPYAFAEKSLNKMMKLADKHVIKKIPPLNITALMKDDGVKGLFDLSKNEKFQKFAGEKIESLQQTGKNLKAGYDMASTVTSHLGKVATGNKGNKHGLFGWFIPQGMLDDFQNKMIGHQETIQKMIDDNTVIAFCQRNDDHCHKTKSLLQMGGVDEKVINLDKEENGNQLYMAIKHKHNKLNSLIFIDGVLVGDSNDLHAKHQSGELKELLDKAGVEHKFVN